MKLKKFIDILILLTAIGAFTIATLYLEENWIKYAITIGSFLIIIKCLFLLFQRKDSNEVLSLLAATTTKSLGRTSELVLLSEENTRLASFDIYGKTGLVIGRDRGENDVHINLDHVADAGLIDVEHAVMNYCANSWYIEDLGSKNGISVQKFSDGRRYKLASNKPCKLERGDVIYIALTRLLLQ